LKSWKTEELRSMKKHELNEWGRRLDAGLKGDPTLELAEHLSKARVNDEKPGGEFQKRLKNELVSRQVLSPKFLTNKVKFAAFIAIIILAFTVVALYPSEPVTSSEANEWLPPIIKWVELDQNRLGIEISLSAENYVRPFHFMCPVEKMVLKTSSGEVISSKGVDEMKHDMRQCMIDEDNNFTIPGSFEHDLNLVEGEMQAFVLELFYMGGGESTLKFEVLPTIKPYVFEEQVLTVKGIEIRLTSVEVNQSTVDFTLCFKAPSDEDWHADPRIEWPTSEWSMSGSRLNPGSEMTPHRCFEHSISDHDGYDFSGQKELTIFVDRIYISAPERPTPEEVEKANRISTKKGVSFEVILGDHSGGFKIISKPEGMSEKEVSQIMWWAMEQSIEGPWTFTVPLP
jgi:hypothetical protein